MRKAAPALRVKTEDRRRLRKLVASRTEPARILLRARIVLAAGAGWSNSRIARELGTSRPTVLLWRRRFSGGGLRGLLRDAPRPGRPRRAGQPRWQPMGLTA